MAFSRHRHTRLFCGTSNDWRRQRAAFQPETMEALSQPGFYAAGEVLDVDAGCGGFNLQWAWSSGRLAGRSAAQKLIKGQAAG